jgi:hypothetical protein
LKMQPIFIGYNETLERPVLGTTPGSHRNNVRPIPEEIKVIPRGYERKRIRVDPQAKC